MQKTHEFSRTPGHLVTVTRSHIFPLLIIIIDIAATSPGWCVSQNNVESIHLEQRHSILLIFLEYINNIIINTV